MLYLLFVHFHIGRLIICTSYHVSLGVQWNQQSSNRENKCLSRHIQQLDIHWRDSLYCSISSDHSRVFGFFCKHCPFELAALVNLHFDRRTWYAFGRHPKVHFSRAKCFFATTWWLWCPSQWSRASLKMSVAPILFMKLNFVYKAMRHKTA